MLLTDSLHSKDGITDYNRTIRMNAAMMQLCVPCVVIDSFSDYNGSDLCLVPIPFMRLTTH